MIPPSYLQEVRFTLSSYSSLQLIESETCGHSQGSNSSDHFPQSANPNMYSVTPSYHARYVIFVKFPECWQPDKKHLPNSSACARM